jgi:drug/metabolite transporter (DMT)-like permease
LAEVFALEFTVPIWTAIIAALYLKEAITVRKVCALLLGAAGVLVILEAGLEAVQPMALVVLLAALFYSASHIATKGLANTEDPLTVLFYMCLIQLPLSALMSLGSLVTPTLALRFWLAVVSVLALTGHYRITQAMRLADACVVVTLDFLRLPLIALIGVVAYAEPFEISLLFGAGLMLLGNLINIYRPQPPQPLAPVVEE